MVQARDTQARHIKGQNVQIVEFPNFSYTVQLTLKEFGESLFNTLKMPITIWIMETGTKRFDAKVYLRDAGSNKEPNLGSDLNALSISRRAGTPKYLYDVSIFPGMIPGVGDIARHFPFTRSRNTIKEIANTVEEFLRKDGDAVEIHWRSG